MLNLNIFRKKPEQSFSEFLQYAACVDEGVMLLKSGGLMCAAEFGGQDGESAGPEELQAIAERLSASLSGLGTRWLVNINSVRTPIGSYISSEEDHYPGPAVARAIEAERRAFFSSERALQFQTRSVMYLTFIPERAGKGFKFVEAEESNSFQRDLTQFKKTSEDFINSLTQFFRVRFLSSVELLRSLDQCLTGLNRPIEMPAIPMYLDAYLSSNFVGGTRPQISNRHLRVVSVTNYPSSTWPLMLQVAAGFSFEYRWSLRWVPLSKQDAEAQIQKIQNAWGNNKQTLGSMMKEAAGMRGGTSVRGDALVMEQDAFEAGTYLASGEVGAGYLTQTFVIHSDSEDRANELARSVVKQLGDAGFKAEVETFASAESFLGSLPGHALWDLRRPMMHSLNLSHIMPTSTSWAGPSKHPCAFYPADSKPLFQAAAAGGAVFRGCLHESDLGHTMIAGPTGAGKSTLLSFLVASHLRYQNAKVFWFDKGYSALALTLATGGLHFDLATDGSKALAPLQDLDSDGSRAKAEEWVMSVVSMSGLKSISAEHTKIVRQALAVLATKPKALRGTDDLKLVLQSDELRVAIAPYCKGGSYASIFCNPRAGELNFGGAQVTTFELEHLMNMDKKAVLPALLHIFDSIEKNLDGSPTMLVLDEAWLLLADPTFSAKIREWLKVLRKANVAVVFATQSLADVMNSAIADVVLESCPTKIWLPNAVANTESVRPLYIKAGLTRAQIALLARSTPKRHYYLTQPSGQRLFEMQLGPVALSFTAVSDKVGVKRVRELAAQHGKAWPGVWLKERGLGDWGAYFDSINN